MPTALITGITGQDGSYLAEFLLEKGYDVHGIIRRSSSFNTERIEHLYLEGWVRDMHARRLINLHYGDMTDAVSLIRIVLRSKAGRNLLTLLHRAMSRFPLKSRNIRRMPMRWGHLGCLRQSVWLVWGRPAGFTRLPPRNCSAKSRKPHRGKLPPFYPYSPYAAAKQYAYWIVKNYREAYGMFAVNGILFNHESERRGESFVTRKITLAIANIEPASRRNCLLAI